ncbi:hypothetical protein [Streptococcus ovis]|uniref:hypothetical protein n=1 Tax=Streptococcus ovis TaxID=82806 RepID=UPI00036D35C4|nr:hypothetical protein [Streptococcus ovis]
MNKEEKQAIIKAIKTVANEFGEALIARNWEEADEIHSRLKPLLEQDELQDMTERELTQEGVVQIKADVKKFYYWSSERRKVEGALAAKGKSILSAIS